MRTLLYGRLFNEWYARDISKKRRISNKVKGSMGVPLGPPPYGYKKDPDNQNHWIIDEEAAQIVRRIFAMTMDGMGTEQIASALTAEHILTPCHYNISKGIGKACKDTRTTPYFWNASTIVKTLSLQAYCGDVVNFKTYSKSFKQKRRLPNDKENWMIFKDVHEPIIDRAVFEAIEKKRGAMRKRKPISGECSIFSGVLVCADCGHNLHFHFNQKNHDITYFVCSNYAGNRGTCPSTHYVREDFVTQVVLSEIKRLLRFANHYENEFLKLVIGLSKKTAEQELAAKRRDLKRLADRDKELDALFEHLYEDNVSGKISDDRFQKMSARYEDEQHDIREQISCLKNVLNEEAQSEAATDFFLQAIRKYTRAKKLTAHMLNELVERIEVYHTEKIDGHYIQKLKIHYTCIGSFEIPSETISQSSTICLQTRKGVEVSYVPAQEAN